MESNTKSKNKQKGPKINWNDLKIEFFANENEGLTEFLRRRLGIKRAKAGHTQRHTKGWFADREKWLEEKAEAVLEEMKKTHVKNHAKALISLEAEIHSRVSTETRKKRLSHKELKAFWEILRTTSGLPIRVNKNLNEDITPNIDKLNEEREKEIAERFGLNGVSN